MTSYCERLASSPIPQTDWLSELLVPPADVRATSLNTKCETTTTTNAAWSMQTQTHCPYYFAAAALETSAHPLADCPTAVSLEKTQPVSTDCGRAGVPSKPNYSYTALVGLALNQSKCNSLPVGAIYAFIENKFPYFKNATKSGKCSWKNSVRHSLSRGHYYRKVEQQGTCTSTNGTKGFHWEIIPEKRAALENELQKYDGVVRGNVTNQQTASTVPSSSEEGIPLVHHTTTAIATRLSPLPLKTQHWSLMNGDTAMSVMTFNKDPQLKQRISALPSLPRLPGMKPHSMEPEVFLFPKPGTYLTMDAPSAEYTIPLVEPYLKCTQLRPPLKLQPPPVSSNKHQRCEKYSCVKGDLNVTKHRDPVPSADVEMEIKRQQSSDSLSDSVFFSPRTPVGPCTPSGDPPSPDNGFDELPCTEDSDTTDTCGITDEELLKKIPIDLLEKYGLDLEFVQKNLPAAQQLLDSGVFFTNTMATPSLIDCNSLPTATSLTTVKDKEFHYFEIQPMALSPLTPIITPQFKNSAAPHATGDRSESSQDQKPESHGAELLCMPPEDGLCGVELARILDHLDDNSLKELQQLEVEFNSCWLSSKGTPPIQSEALSNNSEQSGNNPELISTASEQGQMSNPVSPIPNRHSSLPPTDTELESSNEKLELDGFIEILQQAENDAANALLQPSSRKRSHEDNSIEQQDVAVSSSPEPKRAKSEPTESPSPTNSGSDLMSTIQTFTPQCLNTSASVNISPEFATNFNIREEPLFNSSFAQEMVC